ncbi:MAG TPA: hypothetical protein VLT58_04410 [Polyangia bacterium]|nr:hypothetical protein [Polyangia bacterium]
MELADLNQDERVALAGLMKLVVMSDGDVSEEELEHVEMLVGAFGDDGYQQALDQFEARFPDEPAFRKFLQQGVKRQEARDLIFETILEGAQEGALDDKETGLLDWLSRAWNVKIEIADGTI